MEMEYERLGQLVAVSAIQTGHAGILDLPNVEIDVDYEDYVRSQVHLNLVTGLYGRTLGQYVNALRYCACKEPGCRNSALEVLRYFYSDMAYFLIKNSNNIKFSATVKTSLDIPDIYYDYQKVQSELLEVAENVTVETLRQYQYSWVFDYVDSMEDLKTKIDSYTMAVILMHESRTANIQRVEVGGRNGNNIE